MAAALQKKNARKRRGGPGGGSLSMSRDASLDEEVTPATPGGSLTGDLVSIPNTPITPNVPSTPRMTGSLAVPGHGTDDIITRMKNIELVELGRHKFKPWYVEVNITFIFCSPSCFASLMKRIDEKLDGIKTAVIPNI